MPRRSCRTLRGVALVELLVAAAILAMCVVPITGTISFIRTNAAEARVQAEVQNLLQTTIASRMDGGKLTKFLQTMAPTVTTQTLKAGVSVTLTTTVNPVTGYDNLYEIACTATYAAVSTASRTDTTTLKTYVISS